MKPIENHPNKCYLGDGAFVLPGSYDGELILTTEDGIHEQNRVVLDPSAVRRLVAYISAWGRHL